MDMNKFKEGLSVKEIEEFAKKHRFEVFFCLVFLFGCFFSFIIWAEGWALLLGAVGGVIGVALPGKVEIYARKMYDFFFSQQQSTQIVLMALILFGSIFLAPFVFLLLGMHGGKSIYHHAVDSYNRHKKP